MNLKSFLATVVVIVMASCGPLSEGTTASRIVGLATGSAAPTPTSAGIPREEVLANPGKYLRVNIRNLGQWTTMARAGANDTRVSWISTGEIGLTLQDGIMVATRGLPRDLMGADVSGTVRAIRAGGGNSQRTHEYLTDLDRISTKLLQCRIASQGPEVIERLQESLNSVRFEENCASETLRFTNVYWVNRAGNMIRSLQAVSSDAGYVQIDVF